LTHICSQAHISLLYDTFVEKKKWLDANKFSELLGLGQAIPGPTSTQMVFAIGLIRGGFLGAIFAFFLWSFPGLFILTLSGLGTKFLPTTSLWFIALEQAVGSAAVSLVALAAYRLGSKLIFDRMTEVLMIGSATITILYQASWLFPSIMVVGGFATVLENYIRRKINPQSEEQVKEEEEPEVSKKQLFEISTWTGKWLLAIFVVSVIVLILIRIIFHSLWAPLKWLDIMIRMGSLIFGGGQVVVPMLLQEVVDSGLVTEAEFLDGFALASALPGPLFNFSAYLGALSLGVPGALLCYFGIFFPGLILTAGLFPFWLKYRRSKIFKDALVGINAAAIGLVVAAVFILYNRSIKGDAFLTGIAMWTLMAVGPWSVPTPLAILSAGFIGIANYVFQYYVAG